MKDVLVKKDPKSAEIIRPILRGRDIKRYKFIFKDLFLICTFPSLKINIEDYPVIKQHLLSFGKDRLEQSGTEFYENGVKFKSRKKTLNKWFEIQDTIAYWEEFNKQKIVYSEIVQSPRFHLDTEKFYIEATAFMLTGNNLNYLTCMLNSKTVSQIFRTFYAGGGLGAKGYRYKKNYLINLPLPNPTEDIEKQFASLLLNVRHKPNKKETINEIEDLVISLLDLNQEQKDWIFKKS